MYPCCPVPTLESAHDVLTLPQTGVAQMLSGISEITKQSMLSQLIYLQDFGIRVFKDLVTDISAVSKRVEKLAQGISEFEKSKEGCFSRLRTMPANDFLQGRGAIVSIPEPRVVQLEQANANLGQLLPELAPDVDFEPWANTPKCKEQGTTAVQLLKGMHDPDFFVKQLVDEMTKDKQKREDDGGRTTIEDPQKGTKGVRTTAKTVEMSEASAMLKAFADEAPDQDSVLIVPPPPGDPNWKQQALRLATRKKRALATAQEVWLQNKKEAEENMRSGFTTEAAAPDGKGRLRTGSFKKVNTMPPQSMGPPEESAKERKEREKLEKKEKKRAEKEEKKEKKKAEKEKKKWRTMEAAAPAAPAAPASPAAPPPPPAPVAAPGGGAARPTPAPAPVVADGGITGDSLQGAMKRLRAVKEEDMVKKDTDTIKTNTGDPLLDALSQIRGLIKDSDSDDDEDSEEEDDEESW